MRLTLAGVLLAACLAGWAGCAATGGPGNSRILIASDFFSTASPWEVSVFVNVGGGDDKGIARSWVLSINAGDLSDPYTLICLDGDSPPPHGVVSVTLSEAEDEAVVDAVRTMMTRGAFTPPGPDPADARDQVTNILLQAPSVEIDYSPHARDAAECAAILGVVRQVLERQSRPPSLTDALAAPAGGAVELHLQEGPPVEPRRPLSPLPDYEKQRRYLAWDLGGTGHPAYFLVDMTGVHSAALVVVDSAGNSLVGDGREDFIGSGDRLLILATCHHGYADLICSNCDPGGVDSERWEFDGRRYVRVSSTQYKGRHKSAAYIENQPGAVVACWYCDVFSRPRR
jgi:hypothetical protein